MAIRRYKQMSDIRAGRTKPKALDTLIVDDTLFPLTFRNGSFGYIRNGTFQPVDDKQLVKNPIPRGGSTTWFIRPKGRERVRLNPSKDTQ